MNVKTKYISNVEEDEAGILIETGKIEKKDEYVYLGGTISTKDLCAEVTEPPLTYRRQILTANFLISNAFLPTYPTTI